MELKTPNERNGKHSYPVSWCLYARTACRVCEKNPELLWFASLPHVICDVSNFVFYVLAFYHFNAVWFRHCATSWKVAVSIPDGVIGIFH